MTTYSVGQEVYFAPSDRRWNNPEYITITKVGRKWVECGARLRFDIKTGQGDGRGYMSPGTIFPSKEAFEEAVQAQKLWDTLKRKMGYRVGDAKPHEIREAAKLLRVSLEEG